MGATQPRRDDETGDVEPSTADYYLPGSAGQSSEPGRVERVLKTIFRRRGEVPQIVRR